MSTVENQNNATEKDLKAHFDIKSLGQLNLLLGMKISQGNHIITLFQTHYIDILLEKFRLAEANPIVTPMDTNIKLNHVVEGLEDEE